MSVEFVIFSPLAPSVFEGVAHQCRQRLDAWYEEHDSCDEWGEFFLGGWVPSVTDAAEMIWDDEGAGQACADSPKAKKILERLGTIRSAITIERPGNIDIDRMQVSILRFLVERAGPALVQFVDALELSEPVITDMRAREGMLGFEESEAVSAEQEQQEHVDLAGHDEETPVGCMVEAFVEELLVGELLDVDSSFTVEQACKALLEMFEKLDLAGDVSLAEAIVETLQATPGVLEVYGDDATIERLVREALA
ncbi:MAG: hypothetical protein GY811_14330 [Myxococcales bacterium]|nr:hypothetical protein [Myxococcales bacterium]